MRRDDALSLLGTTSLGLILVIGFTLVEHLSLGDYGMTALFVLLALHVGIITWLLVPRRGDKEESK